ncbi:AFR238Wp [Eremothecium gossypii ATCC 10895]|uniref:AFR238Wp n=1 Tax=Eremothecium gossypii (strain ATCC 10895 / CBS 109.51 / FGSC 9923 / NRRL Y-1056) TaxID=284811 RepID=Q753T8_EREGS|nr:AFR238Wp [Eremothecium gossypii ATCC 10895]AAS53609.1 AFR238Wp [Eremothecium gossypii ATCC 10895]AEY97922.1 FAFR238Wp [Eremothecium gossypii FDAG1]
MGSSELWDIIKHYTKPERLPFRCFVANFKKEHGRSPKIAVDAFQWLFECGFLFNVQQEERSTSAVWPAPRKAILNFVTKLRDLISLDLDFVLVFDGDEKPIYKQHYWKKRGTGQQTEARYSPRGRSPQLPHQLHSVVDLAGGICRAFNVDYITAAGEGEAECAALQVAGSVDYILTNDSDAAIFGASRILRNFSKHAQDLPSSGVSPVKKHVSEYFVTVVDIRAATEEHPTFSRKAFALFAILTGADYGTGLQHLGYKRAWALTQWSNGRFANHFWNMCSTIPEDAGVDPPQYVTFKTVLLEACRMHTKDIFGQDLKYFQKDHASDTIWWPPVGVLQSYYNPKVTRKDFRKSLFVRGASNSATGPFVTLKSAYSTLTTMRIPSLLKDFDSWYHFLVHNSALLKHLLYDDIKNTAKITEEKVLEVHSVLIPLWRVRYRSFLSDVPSPPVPSQGVSPRKRSPSRRQLDIETFPYAMWIAQGLLPRTHRLVEEFKTDAARVQKSPTKVGLLTRSPQKRTLDDYLDQSSSPVKRQKPTTGSETPIITLDSDDSSYEFSETSVVAPTLTPLWRPFSRDVSGSTEQRPSIADVTALACLREPARLKAWFAAGFERAEGSEVHQSILWRRYREFLLATTGSTDTILDYHDLPVLLETVIPGVNVRAGDRTGRVFCGVRSHTGCVSPNQGTTNARRRLSFDSFAQD